MTCETARQAWHRWLDDGVTDPRAEGHLRSCPACAEYRRKMTALVEALDSVRAETEAVDLKSASLVAPRSAVHRSRFAAVLRWAAVLALLVGGGGYAAWILTRTGVGHDQRIVETPSLDDRHAKAPPDDRPQQLDDVEEPRSVCCALRPAPEITPLGATAERFLVVAAEIPAHPEVRLYWMFPTGNAAPAPHSAPGSGSG